MTSTPADAAAARTPTPDDQPDPARWRALAVCIAAGAMTLLDVSIVNVALPTLRAGLRADDSDVQWIVAGYALAFGVALVPMGRLGDARSRRTVFIVGVAVFTLASAAAGAAPVPWLLSVARVVQGLGGGIITPQVSGFIQNLFRGRERAKAFSIFGAMIGISTAIGPLLGGLLVKVGGPDFGWRLVFYVNVPIGIAIVLLARRLLPDGGAAQGQAEPRPVRRAALRRGRAARALPPRRGRAGRVAGRPALVAARAGGGRCSSASRCGSWPGGAAARRP